MCANSGLAVADSSELFEFAVYTAPMTYLWVNHLLTYLTFLNENFAKNTKYWKRKYNFSHLFVTRQPLSFCASPFGAVVGAFAQGLFMYSLHILTVISINRYVAIRFPYKYKKVSDNFYFQNLFSKSETTQIQIFTVKTTLFCYVTATVLTIATVMPYLFPGCDLIYFPDAYVFWPDSNSFIQISSYLIKFSQKRIQIFLVVRGLMVWQGVVAVRTRYGLYGYRGWHVDSVQSTHTHRHTSTE
jgi:hypothetical protein